MTLRHNYSVVTSLSFFPKRKLICLTSISTPFNNIAVLTESSSSSSETVPPAPASDPAEPSGENGIDYDLTKLGSDMLYAEVYNMMCFPELYMGRTIKVSGLFTVFYDEAMDKYHFACFVSDAAACCQQGIEFILDGDKAYPSDYPQEGAEITVTGVFGTYEEEGNTYWALTGASIG